MSSACRTRRGRPVEPLPTPSQGGLSDVLTGSTRARSRCSPRSRSASPSASGSWPPRSQSSPRTFGVSNLAASSVISVFALMRFVSAFAGGRLVNRLGERIVLATGIGIVAVSSSFAGLSQSFPQLLVLRGIGGVGSAMFTVSALSLLLRVAEPEQRGQASGSFQSGFLLGGIFGPGVRRPPDASGPSARPSSSTPGPWRPRAPSRWSSWPIRRCTRARPRPGPPTQPTTLATAFRSLGLPGCRHQQLRQRLVDLRGPRRDRPDLRGRGPEGRRLLDRHRPGRRCRHADARADPGRPARRHPRPKAVPARRRRSSRSSRPSCSRCRARCRPIWSRWRSSAPPPR